MENTPASEDPAGLGEVQEIVRRGNRYLGLIRTSASRCARKMEDRKKRAERQKEKLRAEYEARVDEAIIDEAARDAQRMADLCRQRKELDQQRKKLTHEIQQLYGRMKQDATATKERPELESSYMHRVRCLDEEAKLFETKCSQQHAGFIDAMQHYLHSRDKTPDVMSTPEPLTESEAEPEDADDMAEDPAADNAGAAEQNAAPDGDRCSVLQLQKNAGQDGPPDANAGAEKRNRTPGADNEDGSDQDARSRRKRARDNSTLPTIDYDDVYQGGNPKHMYQIVWFAPHSNSQSRIEAGWFIIRCQQHGLHFGSNGRNALASAAKHISGAEHKHLQKTHANVVETLGWRVQNCDAAKVEKNNAMLRRIPDNGPGIQDAQNGREIIYPEVGKPYITRDGGRAWVVMVLPLGGYFADLGVQGHFDDDLGCNPPRCFKRGPDGKPVFVEEILQWADGYQDGQPRAYERQYPVRFFNKPEKGPAWVKWVRIRDLRPYDSENPKHHKISGSLVARTHYRELLGRREEAWSYIHRQPDVPRPELGSLIDAPTQCAEDDLEATEWDIESYSETSASDWEMTEEGLTMPTTQSLVHHVADPTGVNRVDGQQNTPGTTTFADEGSHQPHSRAPSAPTAGAGEPSQAGASHRRSWLSSPSPTGERELVSSQRARSGGYFDSLTVPPLASREEIPLTDGLSLSCFEEPMRNGNLRELGEVLDLAPVDLGPATTSTHQPGWTQPTGSKGSNGLPARTEQITRHWVQPAPEADMSATATSPQPATVTARGDLQRPDFSLTHPFGRATTELLPVADPLRTGSNSAGLDRHWTTLKTESS